MRIALISYKAGDSNNAYLIQDEDGNLQNYLRQQNNVVDRVTWRARIDWHSFDLIIIKSPWDYHENFDDFIAWLKYIQSKGVPVLNPVDLLVWNSDKHYLKDVADSGLPVIPSIFLEKGGRPEKSDVFNLLQTDEIVLKPCISASAKNTMRLNLSLFGEQQNEIHSLLDKESFIVQPFMREVKTGELSFLFFGGNFSHCIIKMPAKGDFRVQPKFGGSHCSLMAHNDYVESAKKYVDTFAGNSLYARVDALVVKGELMLMELEVIDPYLFFDSDPGALCRYHDALGKMASYIKS